MSAPPKNQNATKSEQARAKSRTFRLYQADIDRLAALAQRLQVSRSEAIRLAIRQMHEPSPYAISCWNEGPPSDPEWMAAVDFAQPGEVGNSTIETFGPYLAEQAARDAAQKFLEEYLK